MLNLFDKRQTRRYSRLLFSQIVFILNSTGKLHRQHSPSPKNPRKVQKKSPREVKATWRGKTLSSSNLFTAQWKPRTCVLFDCHPKSYRSLRACPSRSAPNWKIPRFRRFPRSRTSARRATERASGLVRAFSAQTFESVKASGTQGRVSDARRPHRVGSQKLVALLMFLRGLC